MSRPTNISIAILLLAAAGGTAYWRLASEDSTAAPAAATTAAAPKAVREARQSRYLKLTDPAVRWQVRVDMLRRMDARSLTETDIDTLYELLDHRPAAGQEEQWWVIVNEIMEQMRLQAIGPDRYGKELLGIMRDTAAPEVLRDYAIQHLGQWVTPRGEELGHPSEQNLEITRQTAETLAALATEPSIASTSVPGTSLMVLIDMKGGGVSPDIITPVIDSLQPWFAATLAGSNNTGKITRISAINAIGMLRLESFASEIRAIATSDTTDPSLRLNSIATLGQIGEASDIATLETIAQTDRAFYHAAQAALAKLSNKNH